MRPSVLDRTGLGSRANIAEKYVLLIAVLIMPSLVARKTVEPAVEESWPIHTDFAKVAGRS